MLFSAASEPWTAPCYIRLFISRIDAAAADVSESCSDSNGDKPQSANGSISQANILATWE